VSLDDLIPPLPLTRGDRAPLRFEGLIAGVRFVPTRHHRITRPGLALHDESGPVDEMAAHELFEVLETDGARAFGQNLRTGLIGWCEASGLAPFDGNWSEPLPELLRPVPAALDVARACLGRPFVRGGRGQAGFDAAGLIRHVAFARARSAIGPLAHMTAHTGDVVSEAPRPGDLVFFDDHAGVLDDAGALIHPCEMHGAVLAEPLARICERRGPVRITRRL
jgi:hypothetical protein